MGRGAAFHAERRAACDPWRDRKEKPAAWKDKRQTDKAGGKRAEGKRAETAASGSRRKEKEK